MEGAPAAEDHSVTEGEGGVKSSIPLLGFRIGDSPGELLCEAKLPGSSVGDSQG